MAVLAMRPPQTARAGKPRETTVQEIIDQARTAPAGVRGALAMSLLSAGLMWAAFTPVDFGPLGWICLIPLLALVRLQRPTQWMYRAIFLSGLAFWMPALQWMRLGHPTMYGAWLALATYMAIYFPMFVGLCRVAVWRFGVPLTLAAPVLWTGLELLRGHLMTGFGWYYLAHTQYRWLDLIQISDVTGAYGVSFLIALVAACATELLPRSFFAKFQLLPAGNEPTALRECVPSGRVLRVVASIGLFAAVWGYGAWRRNGEVFPSGPRVALIQGNVTSEVKHDPTESPRIQRRHEVLTGEAVKLQPDIIIWPETMFRWPLLEMPLDVTDEQLLEAHPQIPAKYLEWLRKLETRKRLTTMSQMAGAPMIVGLETVEFDAASLRSYNSAAFVRPAGGVAGRYDKLHRVPFGEYIPLADTVPWLHKFTPFSAGFGINAGMAAAVFEDKGYRYAPIICFEDTVPHLVRDIVNVTARTDDAGEKHRIDCLVNLTNDGWFHGSSELDQHLITAAFRCVECRTPMVRAVNTGISAIIDGDGAIRDRAKDPKTGKSKQVEAVVVNNVPLDSRRSLYLEWGDWFAGACLACCGFFALAGIVGRWLPKPRPAAAPAAV